MAAGRGGWRCGSWQLRVDGCQLSGRGAGVTSFGMGSSVQNEDLRFTHSGGLDSYSSFSVIFPADRSSVVVLCNFPGNGLPNFVMGPNGIRSIMLGRRGA
jgi:hypothetical protein